MRRYARGSWLLAAALAVAGCTRTVAAPAAGQGMPPAMTIERFMRAANQNDLGTMSSLFGTRDGPIARQVPERESDMRMFLLASLLRHSDYAIGTEQVVPGRRDEATRFTVTVTREQRSVEVPFTLVRSGDSYWLIEFVCVERITQGPNAICRA